MPAPVQDCCARARSRALIARRPARHLAPWFALALVAWTSGVAHAQLGVDPLGRSGQPPLPAPDPRRQDAPPPVLPAPVLPPLPPTPGREPDELLRDRFFLREIRIVGSTAFSAEELARITRPYEGREVTAEDLEEVRLALTRLYVGAGYVNSGAILPDQTVSDGVVTMQIVEGALTSVDIEGNRWFRDSYLRRRLTLGVGSPLNINDLQRRLQLLQQDPRIARINSELKPGLRLGESVLAFRVEEVRPYRLYLDVNNYQSPVVGAERGSITLEHQNLTGNGDILSLRYGRSEGVDPQLDFRYAIPITARDTTLALQYRKNDFQVLTEAFRELEIESESEIYTIAIRHPVYRSLRQEVGVELMGERLSNTTSVLGRPFTLSPGAVDGDMTVTALRVAGDWLYRTENFVLAARSRFSFGIDALDATIHDRSRLPDSLFFAWLGQFQWAQRLPFWDSQLIFRTDIQLANDALLALEQIAIGGRYTARGFRENSALRDNATIASLEGRVPVVSRRRWADYVEIAPFVDFARGWNTLTSAAEDLTLVSTGVGLRWALTIPAGPVSLRPQFEVYWGHRLLNRKSEGNDLQDKGLHFQLLLAVF